MASAYLGIILIIREFSRLFALPERYRVLWPGLHSGTLVESLQTHLEVDHNTPWRQTPEKSSGLLR